jgi:hypothetical protein
MAPSWIQDGADGHKFERGPPKDRKCPNLNCISIMMSFLTYITGFFMKFELLPILTDYANNRAVLAI